MDISSAVRRVKDALHDAARWVRSAGFEEPPIDKTTDALERYFGGKRPAVPRRRHMQADDERDALLRASDLTDTPGSDALSLRHGA
jgi:hypothetical protein